MKVGVPKERAEGERRVALVPDAVSRLSQNGFDVLVERGAGEAASFPDPAYEGAGARIVDAVWADADTIVKVQKPTLAETAELRDGEVLIAFLQPLTDREGIERVAARGAVA